jgi:hypothetical protein
MAIERLLADKQVISNFFVFGSSKKEMKDISLKSSRLFMAGINDNV